MFQIVSGDEVTLESIHYRAAVREMCLGIPGQVTDLLDEHEHLARVEVSGVARVVNVGLLTEERIAPGDWVLIHVGFAMSKIDEHEAQVALATLKMLGGVFDDEMEALLTSQSGDDPAGRG